MAVKSTITRKDFLKQSSAAAGALALPWIVPASALGKNGRPAPSDRIVMGCIGVGGQGSYNLRAFANIPAVQVVAVCDVETESDLYYGNQVHGREPAWQWVEQFYAGQASLGSYHGCETYNDFRDLLAREDIDAVTVCTPDHWHGLISVAAVQAGKDIYCEKPLANTVAEGRAVADAVKRYGRVLQTGSHERSRDSVRYACELVRNGHIGQLHTIHVNMPLDEPQHIAVKNTTGEQPVLPVPPGFDYDMWLGHTPWAAYTPMRTHFWWRFILDYGGGEMTDRGAHIIDLAQLGNGADNTGPLTIEAVGRASESGLFNAFLDHHFECTYANGVQLIGTAETPRGLKFEGSDGWIFIHIHGGRLAAEPATLLQEEIGPDEEHLGRSPGHHQNFIDAVKARRDPVASAEVGHRTGTICHLVNIAMQTRSRLEWDPVSEQITNSTEANRLLSRPMRSPWYI